MNPSQVLRNARRHAGLTQARLAAEAGTSQATVSAYESSAKQPSVATLSRLLSAMGLRLAVAPDVAGLPRQPDPARAARRLVEVLELAEALPTRHAQELAFPRLPGARAR
jgi:transcriptional regulator with XRE-family HTH domain